MKNVHQVDCDENYKKNDAIEMKNLFLFLSHLLIHYFLLYLLIAIF